MGCLPCLLAASQGSQGRVQVVPVPQSKELQEGEGTKGVTPTKQSPMVDLRDSRGAFPAPWDPGSFPTEHQQGLSLP